MINELLLQFGQWMEAQEYSQMLVAGYYSYSWLKPTHWPPLMFSIGPLFIINLLFPGPKSEEPTPNLRPHRDTEGRLLLEKKKKKNKSNNNV